MRKQWAAVIVALTLLGLALAPRLGQATPTAQQLGIGAYLPLVYQVAPTTTTAPLPQPTNPPPSLPPSFNGCQADPLASQAPNFPVKIVAIDKTAETVTLRSLSGATVDLTGWTMCSILGNQVHPIGGVLGPEQTRVFPAPAASIWNNSQRDDGALYDGEGRLVSYFVDTDVAR